MQKPAAYIFDLSPKKLAVYLVLGPLVLFLVHTVYTIVYRNLSEGSPIQESFVPIVLAILAFSLAILVLLWLLWLRGTVYSVSETQLGLPRKWFRIAFILLCLFAMYTIAASIIESYMRAQSWGEDYLHMIYASREFINFGGIIIAYPIVCHYAARATTAKRNGTPATFIQAVPFTLLLIFGTVLGLPFSHKYFSTQSSTNAQIVTIYAIAFGLFFFILILGFIAAITGLV